MGIAKHQQIVEEQKNAAAVEILCKVGVLKHCEIHGEIVFHAYSGEVVDAYRYGNAHLKEYGVFESSRDMTDHVKAAADSADYANDGCEICRGQMKD